jgi:hypothetical protein
MTADPTASQQAAVDAALLILERMGLSPDDLTAAPRQTPPAPCGRPVVPDVSELGWRMLMRGPAYSFSRIRCLPLNAPAGVGPCCLVARL